MTTNRGYMWSDVKSIQLRRHRARGALGPPGISRDVTARKVPFTRRSQVSIFHQQKAASILYVFGNGDVPAAYVFSRARWPAGSSQKFLARRARALNNAPRGRNEELIGAYCGMSRFNHPFDRKRSSLFNGMDFSPASFTPALVSRDSVFLDGVALKS